MLLQHKISRAHMERIAPKPEQQQIQHYILRVQNSETSENANITSLECLTEYLSRFRQLTLEQGTADWFLMRKHHLTSSVSRGVVFAMISKNFKGMKEYTDKHFSTEQDRENFLKKLAYLRDTLKSNSNDGDANVDKLFSASDDFKLNILTKMKKSDLINLCRKKIPGWTDSVPDMTTEQKKERKNVV